MTAPSTKTPARKGAKEDRIHLPASLRTIPPGCGGRGPGPPLYRNFIGKPRIARECSANAEPAELVRDFIAGMTARYFEREFRRSVMPGKARQTFR